MLNWLDDVAWGHNAIHARGGLAKLMLLLLVLVLLMPLLSTMQTKGRCTRSCFCCRLLCVCVALLCAHPPPTCAMYYSTDLLLIVAAANDDTFQTAMADTARLTNGSSPRPEHTSVLLQPELKLSRKSCCEGLLATRAVGEGRAHVSKHSRTARHDHLDAWKLSQTMISCCLTCLHRKQVGQHSVQIVATETAARKSMVPA